MATDIPFHFIRGLDLEVARELELNFLKLAGSIDALTDVDVSLSLGVFGDASDGTVNFDGSATVLGLAPAASVYTLTRDIYLADGSQVSGSAVVKTAGYRIFCSGVFTIGASAVVHNNGFAPVGTTAGVGGGVGTLGTISYTGGGGGGFGATGAKGTNVTNSLGGTAGAGGSASSGGTGTGTIAATTTAPATTAGLPRNAVAAVSGSTLPTATKYEGAPGGTSGSSGGSPAGTGAGGGGAGLVGIYAYQLINSGAIQAKGGSGGNASGASGNAGGGGGGGGGAIIVICGSGSTTGTLTVTGGTGGSPIGTGGTGGSGSSGNTYVMTG